MFASTSRGVGLEYEMTIGGVGSGFGGKEGEAHTGWTVYDSHIRVISGFKWGHLLRFLDGALWSML